MTKIGVFDSGYGGLTILDAIRKQLPQYDYLYLGDNARAPYGTHSFDVIYRYTLQAVKYLFEQDCALVILACNTASAKALRTIQQKDLPIINSARTNGRKANVLGVIRPTVEAVPAITKTGHVGILATPATVSSESYVLELQKLSNDLVITQQACPLWVPLIENGEHEGPGAKYFVGKYLREILAKDPLIDTLILGCTHYPLLRTIIAREIGDGITLVNPAYETAQALKGLLAHRGLESSTPCTLADHSFFVSDGAMKFQQFASSVLELDIQNTKLKILE